MSRSSEDISAHSSQELNLQPNGNPPILLPGDQSSQVSIPFMSRHRRGSVDSGIVSKHLSIEHERSHSPSSFGSTSPIEEPSPSSTIDSSETFSNDRPSTPRSEKAGTRNGSSTTGITSKTSELTLPSTEGLAHPYRGHSRANSVGNSPLWPYKGHKRINSQPVQ